VCRQPLISEIPKMNRLFHFALLAMFTLLVASSVHATHNRAGEITYRHIGGLEYEITVTTYTKESARQADRCELTVFFGDSTFAVVPRTNGGPCTFNTACQRCGVNVGNDIKKNTYIVRHTYPGTGTYLISMEDPNRNAGINNIPNSVNQVFYIQTELQILATGHNNSPILTNPPIDNGCLRVIYEHNPGAVDGDIAVNGRSDSLSYRLGVCLGENGTPISGFVQPDEIAPGPNNNLSIDPVTGTLTWDAPQLTGEYNVVIIIDEWRRTAGGFVKIGEYLRDMQVTISNCDNIRPEIAPVVDTCATATEPFSKLISARDGNNHYLTLSATGDPFYVAQNPASFPKKTGQGTVSQLFQWNPICDHVRNYPYFVVFRAADSLSQFNTDQQLIDYLDWRIQVVGPAPQNVQAQSDGEGINISWDPYACNSGRTSGRGFKLYRKMDSTGYVAPSCVTGVPEDLGYELVATINEVSQTSFFDTDNGNGLIPGQRYCYILIGTFADGSESYPSVEACATMLKEVPVMTRVSINSTSLTAGTDSIVWSHPIDLDTIEWPGPYEYTVNRVVDTVLFELFRSSSNSVLTNLDTVYIDDDLNTEQEQYFYRINLLSNGFLVGGSYTTSTVRLNTKSLDNRIELNAKVQTPWTNYGMLVYRKGPSDTGFIFLDSASSTVYTDSNLINGQTYCYYVTTIGEYADPSIIRPLLNNSQEICAIPIDNQPPCPPELTVNSQCESSINDLFWTNPNVTCDSTNDVVRYKVYYAPFNGDSLVPIDSLFGAENNSITYSDLASVAGCYAVTAIDSFGNESPRSNVVCVDNCPYYELPNIFTPGGDGMNDMFQPFDGWRYVKRVDMKIFNRWGEMVFSTEDPWINWNGDHADGGALPSGVYFFICDVYEIRLAGIQKRTIKGSVTNMREKNESPRN
jgi:gliding motility-associated-like protein